MTAPLIYLSPPHMTDESRRLLVEAFDSNWIAPLGPQVDAFERELAAKVGVSDAVALSSGTAALHLALLAVGVEAGQEVLCSTFTFVATANAIRYCGADPVFVDSDRRSWNLDPNLVEDELRRLAAAGRRPAAVVAVDICGQCADYAALEPLCERYGVPLVVDAAESLGATGADRPAGGHGDVGCYSFNGNKIITASGGGALVTNDHDLATRARWLATQAKDAAPHYEHTEVGYNYRMSNLLAAVARGQLRVLDDRVSARRAVFERYRSRLGSLPGVEFMPEAPHGAATRWLTCLLLDRLETNLAPADACVALGVAGIEARRVWKPMHLQPAYRAARCVGGRVAEDLFDRGLSLPSGSALTAEQQAHVCEVLEQALSPRAANAA